MNSKRMLLIIFMMVVPIAVAVQPSTLPNQGQSQPESKNQSQSDATSSGQAPKEQKELQVADYATPESPDPKERAQRKAKGSRYDKQGSYPIEDGPDVDGSISTWSSHWSRGLPAIPAAQSDAILIGEITDAHAYLSNDKTSVYSEFTVLVEAMLKSGNNVPLSSSSPSLLSVQRLGGAVRFPSGHVQKYVTSGQGMPRVGRRYVFFLKSVGQEQDFCLITGYELRGDKVFPVDGASVEEGTQKFPFDEYRGFDASAFLTIVRNAIAETLPSSRGEEVR